MATIDYNPIICNSADVQATTQECDCNYVPPSITKLDVKRDTKGNLLVRVNGEGEWLGARYNEVTKCIEFSY